MTKILTAVVMALGLAGCGFPRTGAAPGPVDATVAASAQGRWADASGESLEKGRQLFLAKCAGCHGYPDLGFYAEAKWEPILARMGPKSDLTADETALVYRFVVATRPAGVEGK